MRSNRTFMELKLVRLTAFGVGLVRSNRTFMELKLPTDKSKTESFKF